MGPDKYKFRRSFKNYLKIVSSEIPSPKAVLDAACAYGKFIDLFKNDNYMGIDINADAILFLKDRYPGRHKFFVVDMVNEIYPKNFDYSDVTPTERNGIGNGTGGFDLVISTHTLSHIAPEKHYIVLDKLIGSTKINGFMILHVNSKNIRTIAYLKEKMIILRESSYRGYVSDVMENNFSVAFHKSRIGGYINNILSFFDPGGRDSVFLCRGPLDS